VSIFPVCRRHTADPHRGVVRQLRNEIVTGELQPGTLIKDAELSARLGVSIMTPF